jgi:hypothetical protein
MGLCPIPRQGMDPLDLLYGPRLDAVGIQFRAEKSFKEYYSLNLLFVAGYCGSSWTTCNARVPGRSRSRKLRFLARIIIRASSPYLFMGLCPIPRQGMDPLDLLYGPKLDAVGIQSRAKESFKEYYSLNLIFAAGHCDSPWTTCIARVPGRYQGPGNYVSWRGS